MKSFTPIACILSAATLGAAQLVKGAEETKEEVLKLQDVHVESLGSLINSDAHEIHASGGFENEGMVVLEADEQMETSADHVEVDFDLDAGFRNSGTFMLDYGSAEKHVKGRLNAKDGIDNSGDMMLMFSNAPRPEGSEKPDFTVSSGSLMSNSGQMTLNSESDQDYVVKFGKSDGSDAQVTMENNGKVSFEDVDADIQVHWTGTGCLEVTDGSTVSVAADSDFSSEQTVYLNPGQQTARFVAGQAAGQRREMKVAGLTANAEIVFGVPMSRFEYAGDRLTLFDTNNSEAAVFVIGEGYKESAFVFDKEKISYSEERATAYPEACSSH